MHGEVQILATCSRRGPNYTVSTLSVDEEAIVVMNQETHHSGGIPLCILIIPECFAQNLEGIASADFISFVCRNSFDFKQTTQHLLSIEILYCTVVLPNSICLCNTTISNCVVTWC